MEKKHVFFSTTPREHFDPPVCVVSLMNQRVNENVISGGNSTQSRLTLQKYFLNDSLSNNEDVFVVFYLVDALIFEQV